MINIYNCISWFPILLVTIGLGQDKGVDATKKDASRHMENGNALLAAGQLAEALNHYNSAIENDPDNFMAYYRRATVYLAMGRSKSALPDLKKSSTLNKKFSPALVNHGNILMKQGNLEAAKEDYLAVTEMDSGNKEAGEKLRLIDPLLAHLEQGNTHMKARNFNEAVINYSAVIEHCVWFPDVRVKRAECYLQVGEVYKAIDDYKVLVKLTNDNTQGFYKMSGLHYQIGELDKALTDIRNCLKLDPEHKECFPFYKKMKKLNKQFTSARDYENEENYEDAIGKYEAAKKTEPSNWSYLSRADRGICHCLVKGQETSKAIKTCTDALANDEENIDLLLDRGEAYIQNEDFDKAIDDFTKANSIEGSQRTEEALKRGNKLLKQSKKRDYYKILGVKRNAKKKEIVQAYRKLAMQWHPDKFEDPEEKKKAENKFIDIAAAKEVLTTPEMREKFDRGEDPLDAEEQQQQNRHWGNPFGFNPFGGGGGNSFRFHFN
ncbi:dnaJ homolog subfamily C member 3-like [Anneissia japonica]|uniref:dnaJ homolog subfamily C member 3-like n=1 Tax=Anneissia japonica TaxID=1529436 RepID=UPI00142582FD|nr:dnaJ homolog subfamily C member 3-like [Anneissia japonica]